MALVGFRYIQATDPGAPPTSGYEWYNTATGDISIRDLGNTMWVVVGNVTQPSLGHVPITGTNMTGPLGGVTGWAPQTSPDFTASAKKDGIDLATKSDVSALRRELLSRFNTITQEVLSNISTSSSTRSNVAFKTGVSTSVQNLPFIIPLPQYDGGSGDTALRSEVIAHTAWPMVFDIPGGAGDDQVSVTLTDDTTMTYLLKSGYANGSNWAYSIKVGYLVLAIR